MKPEEKKILIIKTSSLGDIIHTFSVINYLKDKLPSCTIDWVVEKPFAEIIQAHPGIRKTLCVDTKSWRKKIFSPATVKEIKSFRRQLLATHYDTVYDLQGNVKSGLLTMQANAREKVGFGLSTAPERLNILFTNKRYNPPLGQNIRDDYLSIVQSHIKGGLSYIEEPVCFSLSSEQQAILFNTKTLLETLPKPYVMVCPGSAWPNKQISPRALEEFLKRLQTYLNCSLIYVWGNQEEYALVTSLQAHQSAVSKVLNKLPLPVLQNIMHEMLLVIAMDSLPLHLASTTSTSTFSIFGASSSAKYKPVGSNHYSMQGSCPYGRVFTKRCPALRTCPTGACIKKINGKELFENFCSQWKTHV